MFSCYMCDNTDEWTNTGLCSTCSEISKIIACYTNIGVLETLKTGYLREEGKCGAKAEDEKKKIITRSQNKA